MEISALEPLGSRPNKVLESLIKDQTRDLSEEPGRGAKAQAAWSPTKPAIALKHPQSQGWAQAFIQQPLHPTIYPSASCCSHTPALSEEKANPGCKAEHFAFHLSTLEHAGKSKYSPALEAQEGKTRARHPMRQSSFSGIVIYICAWGRHME